jgi:hypothetical protein
MTTIEVIDRWTGPGKADAVITPASPAENAAHPSPSRRAFEHWYFDARLDDGHVVVGFLQTAELLTKRPGVELHVYRPDGTRREIRKRYPKKVAHASSTRFHVQVGENWGRALDTAGDYGSYEFHLAEEDLAFDLRFDAEVPMWKPGEGLTNYGATDFFAWVVPAPRARVSGTIEIDGERLEVSGIGYHDHNWGIGSMGRIVDHWYWGRVYAGDITLVYANVFARKRYGHAASTPAMVAKDGRLAISTGEITIQEGPKVYSEVARQHYPSWLELKADELHLRLDVREVIHAHDFLSDVPVLRAGVIRPAVNKLVGQPGYFRFRSDFNLTATIDGETHRREGSTLHEMVALR